MAADATVDGWGGLLKDWSKPKEAKPVEAPFAPEPDDAIAAHTAQQMQTLSALQQAHLQQQMQQITGMSQLHQGLAQGMGNPYQQQGMGPGYDMPSLLQGLMQQAPPPAPMPLVHTIYGKNVKTLTAEFVVSGLQFRGVRMEEVDRHVRRELADRLAAEMMRRLNPSRADRLNNDEVVFRATVHIAFD